MTRADLEKSFEHEGGISSLYEGEPYALNECWCPGNKRLRIHLDISFKPYGVDDKTYNNPNLFQKWLNDVGEKMFPENPKDIITAVSKPYCGPAIAD